MDRMASTPPILKKLNPKVVLRLSQRKTVGACRRIMFDTKTKPTPIVHGIDGYFVGTFRPICARFP